MKAVVLLSGGLDSCAVLGLAARHHPDPIRAFTLTFDHADYDEEKEAREMAARVGAEFFPIPMRQNDLADHFAAAILQSETLCVNAHGVAKYLLSRAVRDAGYKVVITGEGSDEILGGYAHFRRDMLLYNTEGQDPESVASLLEDLARLNPVSRGLLLPHGKPRELGTVRRVLGFVPSWMETFSARSGKMRELFSKQFLADFGEREGFRAILSDVDVPGQLAAARAEAPAVGPDLAQQQRELALAEPEGVGRHARLARPGHVPPQPRHLEIRHAQGNWGVFDAPPNPLSRTAGEGRDPRGEAAGEG